jgi:hypothetical protein
VTRFEQKLSLFALHEHTGNVVSCDGSSEKYWRRPGVAKASVFGGKPRGAHAFKRPTDPVAPPAETQGAGARKSPLLIASASTDACCARGTRRQIERRVVMRCSLLTRNSAQSKSRAATRSVNNVCKPAGTWVSARGFIAGRLSDEERRRLGKRRSRGLPGVVIAARPLAW